MDKDSLIRNLDGLNTEGDRVISGVNIRNEKGEYKGDCQLEDELKKKFKGAEIIGIEFRGWLWYDIEKITLNKNGKIYTLTNRIYPSAMVIKGEGDTMEPLD